MPMKKVTIKQHNLMLVKKKMQTPSNTLNENLEYGDLKRLVHDELHIDEYKSKMGDDADVCVLSFKVAGKEPSIDLVNFIEKGYEFVLDADVSSGEKEGGDYLVFVELERTKDLPEQIMRLLGDIKNLTEVDPSEWRVVYRKSDKEHDLTEEVLARLIPLTQNEYNRKYEREQDELDAMRAVAGVKITTKAPKNEYTESLRIAAGLK
jgi:hypothetical protein